MNTKLRTLILTIIGIIIYYNSFGQSVNMDKNIKQDSSEASIEISAKFMGGGVELFREWVQKNLVYSPIAVEKGIYGKIMVKFSIDETGKLYHAEIYKGVDPLLDNEALRVIQSSPLWEPAKLNEKNVEQSIVMPVVFVLNKKQLKMLSE
jgi:periplasmic protein TonB